MKPRALVFAALVIVAPTVALAHSHTPAEKAYMDAHQKMMAAMVQPSSGDPDETFAMMMIPHHQGAIDMAKVELQYGKDPELRAMAQKIIDAQEKEIAEFKAWQEQNGQ